MWLWEGAPQEPAFGEGSNTSLPPQGHTEPRAQRKRDTQHLPPTSKSFSGFEDGEFFSKCFRRTMDPPDRRSGAES